MKVQIKHLRQVCIVAIEGYINSAGGEEVARVCYEKIWAGQRFLLLDLADIKLVDSTGISIMIEIIEKILEVEGKLAFCNLRSTIEKRFRLMEIHSYAEIFPDRDSAIASLISFAQGQEKGDGDEEKRVILFSATQHLLAALRQSMDVIHQISPEQFELLVCDRLDAMGFEVRRTGHAFAPDGGVDIISWPKMSTFPYLFAVQVKHRRHRAKIGPEPVRGLMAALNSSPFDAGLLVTNTTFTPSAKWWAQHGPRILRLRDLEDLRRWISGNFIEGSLRELPKEIELAPGITVRLR